MVDKTYNLMTFTISITTIPIHKLLFFPYIAEINDYINSQVHLTRTQLQYTNIFVAFSNF